MDKHLEADIDDQFKIVSNELDALKAQFQIQAQCFEDLVTSLSMLQGFAAHPNPSDDVATRPKLFIDSQLPDPAILRRILRLRQRRGIFFPGIDFADPAWEILLDLAAAKAERKRVSVTSLCLASGVAPTTALRWIAQMTKANLLVREEDEVDRRRIFVRLTEHAERSISRYFIEAEEQIELFA